MDGFPINKTVYCCGYIYIYIFIFTNDLLLVSPLPSHRHEPRSVKNPISPNGSVAIKGITGCLPAPSHRTHGHPNPGKPNLGPAGPRVAIPGWCQSAPSALGQPGLHGVDGSNRWGFLSIYIYIYIHIYIYI